MQSYIKYYKSALRLLGPIRKISEFTEPIYINPKYRYRVVASIYYWKN